MTSLVVSLLLLAAPPTPGEAAVAELGVPELAGLADLPKAYQSDSITEEQIRKAPEKYPVRLAVLDAAASVRKSGKLKPPLVLRQSLVETEKKAILAFQEDLAAAILLMREATTDLTKANAKRKSESSARWLAHLEFLIAYTKYRTATLEELNLAYGLVHRNELPKVEEKHNGWALTNVEKMHSKGEIRSLAEEAREEFAAMGKAHPGTPWAKLADRELDAKPGLQWVSAEVKPPPPKIVPKKKP